MKLSSRLLRRIIIAGIFLAVFSLTGLGLKKVITPVSSCTDGIMNGEEEGVDCGAIACGKECEPDLGPPQVISTKLIKTGGLDYDFVAEILNPHKDFGASEVSYELTLFNQEGEELLRQEGVFYLLPEQTKFVILPFLTTENNVGDIDLKIKSAKWQKLESLEGMNFLVRREKYTKSDGSSHLEAVVINDSDFDFQIVDIDIILLNSDEEIIAVYKTDVRKLLARTERHFVATWPFTIGDKVDKTEFRISTNLFYDLNYLKRYGSGIEQFQQY
ncbi:MAG: hypothetical protein Q8R55_07000 [Candidatus Taylorbacteria bacterium]|nr:hypothetical protein [Candidatus Taylorbacteria bacterium]